VRFTRTALTDRPLHL